MGVFQQNRPKNTGSYGLERKEACEDDKNVNFLKSKTWVFSKGVNRWFRSKNPQIFSVCFSDILY